MYVLFTDETNLPSDPRAKFFAYGGLIVHISSLPDLHDGIAAIRATAGYAPGDELKFETNARPSNVSIEAARVAKSAVINLCIELECRFIAYVVLHDIARNTSQEALIRWGADHVIGKFNVFLGHRESRGIVALDRLSSSTEYRLLTDKFVSGLTFDDDEPVHLENVLLFSSTCINASHASSAMDIVLGAFRYCINQPPNVAAAQEMMRCVAQLVWCTTDGQKLYALEKGLVFRPKNVKVAKYAQEYQRLLEHINSLIATNTSTE